MQEKIDELRKNVDLGKYYKLKEKNENDMFYNWAFDYDDVLYENIADDNFFKDNYLHDIGLVYIEILENCQKKKITMHN